jgi:hypothetical protein
LILICMMYISLWLIKYIITWVLKNITYINNCFKLHCKITKICINFFYSKTVDNICRISKQICVFPLNPWNWAFFCLFCFHQRVRLTKKSMGRPGRRACEWDFAARWCARWAAQGAAGAGLRTAAVCAADRRQSAVSVCLGGAQAARSPSERVNASWVSERENECTRSTPSWLWCDAASWLHLIDSQGLSLSALGRRRSSPCPCRGHCCSETMDRGDAGSNTTSPLPSSISQFSSAKVRLNCLRSVTKYWNYVHFWASWVFFFAK